MRMISSKHSRVSKRCRIAALLGMTMLALSTAPLTAFAQDRSAQDRSAQDRPVAIDKPRLAQAPEPLCFCWSDGKKIAEGATACIRTTMGRRLAACGRVINMMSWEVTENPCPES